VSSAVANYAEKRYFTLSPLVENLKRAVKTSVYNSSDRDLCKQAIEGVFRVRCHFCGTPGHSEKVCGNKKQLQLSITTVTGNPKVWEIIRTQVNRSEQELKEWARTKAKSHKVTTDI
jgi:hypothetical protein